MADSSNSNFNQPSLNGADNERRSEAQPAPEPAAAAAAAVPPPPLQQNIPFNIVNVDIANPFNYNPNLGGANNLFNMRERLFNAIYFRGAVLYAQVFPSPMRRALEYFILLKAILFFMALVYIHVSFIKNPATCLQHVQDWPRDGVLRVEIIPNWTKKRELLEQYKADKQLRLNIRNNFFYGIGPQTKDNHEKLKKLENSLKSVGYNLNKTFVYRNETVMDYLNKQVFVKVTNPTEFAKADDYDDEEYIVEYALEYGHLRLSPATRKRLNIPVRVVQLDPVNNKCFGSKLSKILLRTLLGYDDLLMASVRVLAEKEDHKGYLRNVITGEHYRFVSMWWAAWSSYFTAFSIMTLFTFSITILLRFSHYQIFAFIVDLLQMLEFNGTARFPIAPLLTVILALVGMEAIMSEFFNDTTTAFYIIVIVWIADQFDVICCHTNITKRYWLRFFYLYHFAFYAYHYRFSGQNRSLALLSSWLFIQHSMLFFFHRYELPVILQQAEFLARRNEGEEDDNEQPQQEQQQRRLRLGTSHLVNRFFGRLQQERRQQQQQQPGQQQPQGQPGHANGERQRQVVPLLGALFVRRGAGGAADGAGGNAGGGTMDTIRRALTARGWNTSVHVHIQVRNLQRIQLGSIQIQPNATNANASNNNTNGETNPSTTAEPVTTTTTTTTVDSDISSRNNAETTVIDETQSTSTNAGQIVTNNLARVALATTPATDIAATPCEKTNKGKCFQDGQINLDMEVEPKFTNNSNSHIENANLLPETIKNNQIKSGDDVGDDDDDDGDDDNNKSDKLKQHQNQYLKHQAEQVGNNEECSKLATDVETDIMQVERKNENHNICMLPVTDETTTNNSIADTTTLPLLNDQYEVITQKTIVKNTENISGNNNNIHNNNDNIWQLENKLHTVQGERQELKEETENVKAVAEKFPVALTENDVKITTVAVQHNTTLPLLDTTHTEEGGIEHMTALN